MINNRGPIWVNVNYLALKALKYYGTTAVTAGTIVDEWSLEYRKLRLEKFQSIPRPNVPYLFNNYEIQRKRSLRLYHELRKNIQNSVLQTYHDTGNYWEHYEDEHGKGTRGHPFTGWTALIVNIMADI